MQCYENVVVSPNKVSEDICLFQNIEVSCNSFEGVVTVCPCGSVCDNTNSDALAAFAVVTEKVVLHKKLLGGMTPL